MTVKEGRTDHTAEPLSGDGDMDDAAYCRDQVRLEAHERYLASLYMPDDKRGAALAIYAFYGKISAIPGLVSEPQLGEIQLAWWREAIDDLFAGRAGAHPVLREIGRALEVATLEKSVLMQVIDARARELYATAPPSKQGFQEQAYALDTALLYLLARLLAPDHAGATTQAARDAGLTLALLECLRTLPAKLARGQNPVPQEAMAAHGVDAAALIQGEMNEDIAALFADLRGWAQASLDRARDRRAQIPDAVLPAFLPLAMVEPTLKAMSAKRHNPLRQSVRVSPLKRQWRIMRAARKGMF